MRGALTYQTHAFMLSRDVAASILPLLKNGFASDAALVKVSRPHAAKRSDIIWWKLLKPFFVQNRARFPSDVRPRGLCPDRTDTTRRVIHKRKRQMRPASIDRAKSPSTEVDSPTILTIIDSDESDVVVEVASSSKSCDGCLDSRTQN